MSNLRAIAIAVVSLVASLPCLAQTAAVVIDNYTLVTSARVSRTTYEYTYKVEVSNWSGVDASILATLESTAPTIDVVENIISFASVLDGETRESFDTFVARHDRSQPFDPEALKWTVTATPLPATTFELIDQARATGAISEETALIYQVFAAFEDDRLPAAYQGRDDGFIDNPVVHTLAERFDSLSPETQALLAPFLKGVAEPGNWLELQVLASGPLVQPAQAITDCSGTNLRWQPVATANGAAIVWWLPQRPQDQGRAQAFANELDTYLWSKLTGAFRTPLPDLWYVDGAGDPVYGCADPRLDIFLSPRGGGVFTRPPEPPCDGTPEGGMVRLGPSSGKESLAHELMHAIEFAYQASSCRDKGDFRWMDEAMAEWAAHFAYPKSNYEHPAAAWFLRAPEEALTHVDKRHEYGAYLWFFRLAGQDDNPGPIRAILEAASSKPPLEAIESVLQDAGWGGFQKQWPRFALDAWNRVAAVGKPYRQFFEWDNLKHRVRQSHVALFLGAGGDWRSEPITYVLPHLSASYHHFDFRKDKRIRTVLFAKSKNPLPTETIHAILKVRDKDWQQAEDWSDVSQKLLCRDNPQEDIEELVLVFTNRGFRTTDPSITSDEGGVGLTYSAVPCSEWTGTTTYRLDMNVHGSSRVLTATGSGLRFRSNLQN